jgi:hypothetical protein
MTFGRKALAIASTGFSLSLLLPIQSFAQQMGEVIVIDAVPCGGVGTTYVDAPGGGTKCVCQSGWVQVGSTKKMGPMCARNWTFAGVLVPVPVPPKPPGGAGGGVHGDPKPPPKPPACNPEELRGKLNEIANAQASCEAGANSAGERNLRWVLVGGFGKVLIDLAGTHNPGAAAGAAWGTGAASAAISENWSSQLGQCWENFCNAIKSELQHCGYANVLSAGEIAATCK